MTSQAGNNLYRGLRGLTLIELMAVMSIMIIIVSAIVVAAYAVQRQGQIKATGAVLQQLSLALETYRAQHRMYVPRAHDKTEGLVLITEPIQVEDSSEALWMALEYVEKIPTNVKDSNKHSAGSIQAHDTGEYMTTYFYQDAWRQPILYECARGPFTRFMLRSTGPDLEFGTSDDIIEGDDLSSP